MHILQREKHVFQLFLRKLIQKVRLVFVPVGGFLQKMHAVFVGNFAVMSRGDIIGAELFRFAKKRSELDFAVAEHVRVRRSSRGVFGKKVRKNAVEVFFGEIYGVIGNIDDCAHFAHVCVIVGGGTHAVFVGFFPVAHKQPDDVIALLF